MRRMMLLIALVATTALGVALVVAVSAEAYPCYQNGKTIPPQTCAFINMNEYVTAAYFQPYMEAFWVKPTARGRFHSRWVANVPTAGGLFVRRRVTLSAKGCRGTYVVFDHRKQQWASRC